MEDGSKKDIQCNIDLQRTHLWSYFELHANQRITLFRYYTIILGLFVTTAGVVLIRYHQQPYMEEVIGIVLSIVFLILTISFCLLDRRNRQLIHYAEKAIRNFEKDCVNKKIFTSKSCVFTTEYKDKKDGKSRTGHTRCFFNIYITSFAVAIILLLYSVWSAGYYSHNGIKESQLSTETCCYTCCNDLLP